jgi:hypothetical protein
MNPRPDVRSLPQEEAGITMRQFLLCSLVCRERENVERLVATSGFSDY